MYEQLITKKLLFLKILIIFFQHFVTEVLTIEILIKDRGIGYVNPGDIAMIFYVTIENKCKRSLEISVDMVRCCETTNPSEVDCNYMLLVGGYMGTLSATQVKNVTLIYPNLYLENRQGICTVAITYRSEFKKREITSEIHFDTSKYCTDQNKCESVDLSPSDSCSPVDCLIKYSGEKSFFDPKCKNCKTVPCCNSKTPTCLPDIVYSPFSNHCVKLKNLICKEELEAIEKNMTDSSCAQNLMANVKCHNGITKDGECSCFEGWTTTTYDEEIYQPTLAQYHMCNIQVGNWNCVNRSKVKWTVILIIIFAITLASKILLLMCLLNWCYKHFHKPPKPCARFVSSDDESLVLCEELKDFDKCSCGRTDQPADNTKKSASKLQAQTVNVTYYPGKTYSTRANSDNGSSISTKGSSIAISFQSRTTEDGSNSKTENSEMEVEEDYEIEFFDEEEEDDMDQLSVEEDKNAPSLSESSRTLSKKSSTSASDQAPAQERSDISEDQAVVSKSSTDLNKY